MGETHIYMYRTAFLYYRGVSSVVLHHIGSVDLDVYLHA